MMNVGIRRWLVFVLLAFVIVGCDRFQPARTPTSMPTAEPSSIRAPTEAPSEAPLPTTTTLAPSNTPALTVTPGATDTPQVADTETLTATPTATATNTRVPFTPRPKATATKTAVALKYTAPVLIEPGAGDTRLEGKDDLLLRWKPVADLGPSECYLVTLQVVNLADPLQHYGQDSFVAQDSCNSAISSGIVEFTLRKKNPPSYRGLVDIASSLGGPSNQFKVKWWVTVVMDRGPDPQNPGKELTTPLSPPSTENEFALQSP
jgi:cytoskeletal protein RodZ